MRGKSLARAAHSPDDVYRLNINFSSLVHGLDCLFYNTKNPIGEWFSAVETAETRKKTREIPRTAERKQCKYRENIRIFHATHHRVCLVFIYTGWKQIKTSKVLHTKKKLLI